MIVLGDFTMWIFVLAVAAYVKVSLATKEPSFETPIVNVTVLEGVTAVLPCAVRNLGRHKVAWTDQWSTLLAFMDTRITDDTRISVDRPFSSDWNLHISGVKYDDQGIYNCQVNTKPIKILTVVLNILVPPRILGGQNKHLFVIKEDQSVSLVCNVSGIPRPTVTWYKKPSDLGQKKESEFCPATSRIGYSGEILVIHNITRYCGGTYECVADNGVPPPVKRQMEVAVEFSPQITIHNKRISQARRKDTILECIVTAYPQAVSVWRFRNRDLPMSKGKHHVELFEEGRNTITLSLRISNLNKDDFGQYTCVASNSMGRDSKRTVLYELIVTTPPPTTLSTTTTTTTRRPTTPLRTPSRKSDHPQGRDYYKDKRPDVITRLMTHPDKVEDSLVSGPAGSTGRESGACSHSVFYTVFLSGTLYLLTKH